MFTCLVEDGAAGALVSTAGDGLWQIDVSGTADREFLVAAGEYIAGVGAPVYGMVWRLESAKLPMRRGEVGLRRTEQTRLVMRAPGALVVSEIALPLAMGHVVFCAREGMERWAFTDPSLAWRWVLTRSEAYRLAMGRPARSSGTTSRPDPELFPVRVVSA